MNGELYDKNDIESIFNYSKLLIGHTLRDFEPDAKDRKGKGGFGQLVEEVYFKYKPNSNESPDFEEAGLELKITPVKKNKNGELAIKERLVCCKIDYMKDCEKDFNESHFYKKCLTMLILFYLHQSTSLQIDLRFLYQLLWRLPEKDLIIIRNDYEFIRNKIKSGNAHLLSEGDTMFLAACRKGQKDEALKKQPNSNIGAPGRAWSLKSSYMQTLLKYVEQSGETATANFEYKTHRDNIGEHYANDELVSIDELKEKTFDKILLDRYKPFYGKNVNEILEFFGKEPTGSKNKYAIAAGYIGRSGESYDINHSDEFLKAGLTMKTIRVESNGGIKESMSFENIDYQEVYECDDWLDSRLYEMFSNRFMFVVYRATEGKIKVPSKNDDGYAMETAYVLDKVFFWTMPQEDLRTAKLYWEDIRKQVLADNIKTGAFWKDSDKMKFHVRPKGQKAAEMDYSPVTGEKTARQFCYWFNNEYVRNIIKTQEQ